MNYTLTEESLLEAMEDMVIVDAHEHLPPEHVRTSAKVDALTLFAHYTRTDLVTAGMKPEDYERVIDSQGNLDERWKIFKPYLEHIRYGSYAKPAFIAAKEFYGFDDINDSNYREISERMQAQNTPGIYHRILRDRCKIRVALTQAGRTDYDDDLLVPLMPMDAYISVRSQEDVSQKADNLGMKVTNLDDYMELAKKGVIKWKSEGAVGLKMASIHNNPPDRKAAEEVFNKIMTSTDPKANFDTASRLRDFLMNYVIDVVGE